MKSVGTMSIRCYLTVNSSGAVRVTKNMPGLNFDEIAIGLRIDLPKALFMKPQLQATLVIPDDVAMPSEIPVDVVAGVRDAIEQSTGLEVRLSLAERE